MNQPDFSFRAFGKIPRLNREIIITEKIDGTNAQIFIYKLTGTEQLTAADRPLCQEGEYLLWAGSRNRYVYPGKEDNHGFAAWVKENAYQLVLLGEGRHFGEWWGQGIQRGYGLTEKRFSLFRWPSEVSDSASIRVPVCIVPVLYQGPFSGGSIIEISIKLALNGSAAAPGFMDAEGIVVFHTASRQSFKVTLKDDAAPKSAPKEEVNVCPPPV